MIDKENNKLILIAEDSLTQAERLRYMLEKIGYTVRHAINGKEALDTARKERPLLILSDIRMPEMDGYELCKTVKNDKTLWDIPFILLTVLDDPRDVIMGIECGADSYMMKPYSDNYLLSRINQVLDNKHLLTRNKGEESLEINFAGAQYHINSNPLQILNLLLSTYDSICQKNTELAENENEMILMNQDLQNMVEKRKMELKIQLEQKIKAEKVLEKSAEQYRELVDNALIGVIITTGKGEILFANSALIEMLEYEIPEEFLKKGIIGFYKNPQDRDELMRLLNEKGEVPEFEVEFITKTGNLKHVVLSVSLDNNLMSGMILDITERKTAELRVKQYKDEMILARERAEQSEKLKTAFLANMSNEILTPINSLLGFSELLSTSGLSDDKILEYTSNINGSGNNLINLIDNIIDIAKIESGEVKIKRTDCKINHLLLDLYAHFEEELKVYGKENVQLYLKRGVKDQDFTIQTESHRLKKVLTNLIGNAVKYTDSGRIEFGFEPFNTEASKNGTWLKFFVRDTGKGLDENHLPRIFDRFRNSADPIRKLSEGAGVGLPISKAYVQLLGGEMWCDSEPGKGSEFYFTLLCGEGKTEAMAKEEPPISGKPLKSENPVILIAEDVESNFVYLKALLEETGCQLIWAKNGREAIEKYKAHSDIMLIMMDIRMPIMGGYEAISEIRKFDKEVPIIVQTAYAREEDRQKIETSGCNDFITKPIKREILLKAISKYLVIENAV
jgi:PAS domain S-box-containing protein